MDGLEASMRQERRCSAAKKENKWKYTYCVYKVGGLTFCICRKQESQFSSVQFSHSVMSNSLRPHESQHTRPPCPSPTPGAHSDSHPSSQ